MPRLLSIMLGAIALIAAVVGIRALMPDGDSTPDVQADRIPTLDKALPDGQQGHNGTVTFIRSRPQQRTLYLSLGGRSEAEITTVAFGAAGKVTLTPGRVGQTFEKGALLCGLDVEGANARMKQAEEASARRKEALAQAQERFANGWVSEARVKTARAELDAAQAGLELARNELARMQAVSPARGVLESRAASVGQFVTLGSPCGTIVRLDPITFLAGATERQAVQVKVGAPVRVKLSDGTEVRGEVEHVGRVADPESRTFPVKVSVPNKANAIPVGRHAELKIEIGPGKAHPIPQNLLTTDEQGRIGVRYLDVGGIVSFAVADIVDEGDGIAWVRGLPDEAQVVAEGQEHVRVGLGVTPVIRETPAKTETAGGG